MKRIVLLIFCLCFITCGCKQQNKTAERSDVVINIPKGNESNEYFADGIPSTDVIPEDEISVPKTETITTQYCGNKNSKKFHKLNCSSLNNTKEENKVYYISREEYINNGYSPCKMCNP